MQIQTLSFVYTSFLTIWIQNTTDFTGFSSITGTMCTTYLELLSLFVVFIVRSASPAIIFEWAANLKDSITVGGSQYQKIRLKSY